MHDYAAYGLKIRSDLALPELVEASASGQAPAPRPQGDCDVSIRISPINRKRPDNYAPDAPTWATPDAAFLEYPGSVAFLIRGGSEIVIDPAPHIDPSLIRLFLLGPALALLLHQRNFLVLHASAISLNGGVAAFVGEKGMGKSTMAAALHARGHALVADDIVAIDTASSHPLVYPGFPQLKLFPESAALLDTNPQHLPKVHPDFEKRARRAIEGFPTEPLELRGIFVLSDADSEGIEPMPGRQGFMELVRHSYLLGFLNATGSAATHFRQAISLASRIPVVRLLRRRILDKLPKVVAMVEGHARQVFCDTGVPPVLTTR